MNIAGIEALYIANFDRSVKHYTAATKGDVMAAEDIVQDAFVRALSYRESCPEDPALHQNWLRFQMRKAFQAWRRDGKYASAPKEVYEKYKAKLPTFKDEMEDGDIPVDQMSDSDKQIKSIIRDIRILSQDYPALEKKAIDLHFCKGYRIHDLTEVYDLPRHYFSALMKAFVERVRIRRGKDEIFTGGQWVVV